jgi:hypothetical protein
MSDNIWRHLELLAGIRDTFDNPYNIDSKTFREKLPGIHREISDIYYDRLNDKRQARFMECIWQLARPNELPDEQTRRKYFESLAKHYDCIFLWVEEGNPGTVRNM